MSESMEQPPSPTPINRSLEGAAGEFRARVEEAAARLSGAAEQFVAMSESLLSAVEEARQAAARAQEAQQKVETLESKMAQDYGSVSGLVQDLQERISALATLARPLPDAEPKSQGGSGSEPEAEAEHETPTPLYSAASGGPSW